jgi:hypothetical protein
MRNIIEEKYKKRYDLKQSVISIAQAGRTHLNIDGQMYSEKLNGVETN